MLLTEPEREALACLKEVRWRLLESYALARQEGLVEPVGLVIDPSSAYAQSMTQRLLLAKEIGTLRQLTATCMERAVLIGLFSRPSPDIATALKAQLDEPARWTAIILAKRGCVLTGSWQELFTLEAEPERVRGRR
jgi:hypothetical protein